MITVPPKLYLDTCHLVNITRIREGSSLGSSEKYRKDYVYITKCIRDGMCTLVFNPYAPLEWVEGKATEESALQIAKIFDQAKCIYQSEADTHIYASELLMQCKKIDPVISFPDLHVMHYLERSGSYTPVHTIIAQNVPDYDFGQKDRSKFPDKVPVVSISEHVIESFRLAERNPKLYQRRGSDFKYAFEQTKEQAEKDFTHLPKHAIIDWMKRFLQIDKILKAAKCKTVVEELLNRVDITKCTAVNLYVKIWENLIRAC